jgi:hypothetical protein
VRLKFGSAEVAHRTGRTDFPLKSTGDDENHDAHEEYTSLKSSAQSSVLGSRQPWPPIRRIDYSVLSRCTHNITSITKVVNINTMSLSSINWARATTSAPLVIFIPLIYNTLFPS